MNVIKCSHCGKELPGESNFCPYCMEQINKPTAVSVPTGKKKFSKDLLIMVSVTVFLSALMMGLLISRYYNIPASKDGIQINDTTEDSNKTQGLQIFDNFGETNSESGPEEGNISEDVINSNGKNTTADRNIIDSEDMNKRPGILVNIYPEENTTQHKTQSTTSSVKGNTPQSNPTEKITQSNNNSGSITETEFKGCNHNWVAQTKIVHHDEVGHYEEVKKTRPVTKYRCDICSKVFDSTDQYYNHFDNTHTQSYPGDPITIFREEYREETDYEEYTEKQWVIDKAACDETVVTGYKCSLCGKTR